MSFPLLPKDYLVASSVVLSAMISVMEGFITIVIVKIFLLLKVMMSVS